MKLEKIASIKTRDNDFMEFVLGVLITDPQYYYNIEVSESPKEYTIDIFDTPSRNYNNPDSILGSYLHTKQLDIDKGLSNVPEEVKSTASGIHLFCKCPTCGKVYKTLADLEADCIEKERDVTRSEMTSSYICSKCGGQIDIKYPLN